MQQGKNLHQNINESTEASFIGKILLPRQNYISAEPNSVLIDLIDVRLLAEDPCLAANQ